VEEEEEIRADAERLEKQGDEMDEGTDELQKRVDDAREDLKAKQHASDVPGAQPPAEEVEAADSSEEASIS
jgi:hypothetical protein